MPDLKFSRLSLLSQSERTGLQIDLRAPKTLLTAGNGFGKSAIVKSLYETFGAAPHKIDSRWRSAGVVSVVDFAIDGRQYFALKIVDLVTIFDETKRVLLSSSSIVSEVGPFLANLLSFRLVLSDRHEVARVPPPSFAFAPFYVDQDRSWQHPWSSFRDLGMFVRAKQSLAQYHSGLRTNDYYQAKAERDAARVELAEAEREYNAIDSAVKTVRNELPDQALALNVEQFEFELNVLLREADELHAKQARYRTEFGALNEACLLWLDHIKLLEQSIRELDETFDEAIGHPLDVECPLCGHHYSNGLATQFALKSDRNDLYVSLQEAQGSLRRAETERDTKRQDLSSVQEGIARVEGVLSIAKQGVTFREIVQAEGRAEAQRVLRVRLDSINERIGAAHNNANAAETSMKTADNPDRKKTILKDFSSKITKAAELLDVQISGDNARIIEGTTIGRGSEGPRGLACYYYAFLQTARAHSLSAFCPIVIDAPNQQGQDPAHLASIMSFLFAGAPENAQIIVAAEAVTAAGSATVIDVSNVKGRVLRDDQFEQTHAYVQSFLDRLVKE